MFTFGYNTNTSNSNTSGFSFGGNTNTSRYFSFSGNANTSDSNVNPFSFGSNDTNIKDTSFFNYTKTCGFSFGGNTENKSKEKKINNDKEYLAHKYTKAKKELEFLKKRKIDFKNIIIKYQTSLQDIEKIIKLQEQNLKIYDEMNNIKNNTENNNIQNNNTQNN